MRLALLLPVALLIGAAPPEEPQTSAPEASETLSSAMPSYRRPAAASGDLKDFVERTTCRDKIEYTRAASGQPPLPDREAADAGEPLLYKAVDRDVDGCDVLVMADDTSDIRPVPQGGDAKLIPVN